MGESQAVESAGVVDPEIPILGGEPTPSPDELQPVKAMPPEPVEKPKVLGEFNDESEALQEIQRLRGFQQAVAQDRDVQALIHQRQEQARMQEQAKLSMQAQEQRLLESYAEAVAQGNPDKALLTLVREIRAQANQDAQFAIRRELDSVAEPLRAKQQLMESQTWTDLHPVSDEAVWLATEMGKLGYSKPDVANFLRRFGQKYSGGPPQGEAPGQRRGKRSQGWGMESPDSAPSLADIDDKSWDKAVDNYWKRQGY
jgi:hypothetical protein